MRIDNILNKLKDKLLESEYQSYISLLEYDESASRTDLEIFYVPNIFVAEWIKSNYLNIIADIFEKENPSGVRPEIHIKVRSKNEGVKSLKSNKTYLQDEAITLNPYYTFENFIVGDSNKHAHILAQAVSAKQAYVYNPVVFYGDTGLGKTHLLNAIGNFAYEQNKNVLYVTSENFLNEFTAGLRRSTMDSFRNKYRTCDYLLIDDVQFFGGKEQVQTELFHTFNELINHNKQIVMTSDKLPKDIKGLDERIRSRFERGVMSEINHPELETKISIIESKCEINRISLDKETIDYIASNIHGNIRQIEGILSTINSHISLSPESSSIKVAKEVLKSFQRERLDGITLSNIIDTVAKELNIKPSEIESKTRSRKVAFARRVVIYLARMLTVNSMPNIAKELGMRDHSAVSKAHKQAEKEVAEDSKIKNIIDSLKSRLQQDLGSV